jgi:hypothetical protein
VAPAFFSIGSNEDARFASLTENQAQHFIQADSNDETNGFFVAHLKPKSSRSEETDSFWQMLRSVHQQTIVMYNGEFSTKAENVKESDTCDTEQVRRSSRIYIEGRHWQHQQ